MPFIAQQSEYVHASEDQSDGEKDVLSPQVVAQCWFLNICWISKPGFSSISQVQVSIHQQYFLSQHQLPFPIKVMWVWVLPSLCLLPGYPYPKMCLLFLVLQSKHTSHLPPMHLRPFMNGSNADATCLCWKQSLDGWKEGGNIAMFHPPFITSSFCCPSSGSLNIQHLDHFLQFHLLWLTLQHPKKCVSLPLHLKDLIHSLAHQYTCIHASHVHLCVPCAAPCITYALSCITCCIHACTPACHALHHTHQQNVISLKQLNCLILPFFPLDFTFFKTTSWNSKSKNK